MYQNKLVAAIKVNGQILREVGQSVAIPFGSEYSILVKNLNAVRAQIKVSIDGADVTSGTWLVIQPNGAMELERFIHDGNWDSGRRFRFIERTAAIEAHRGTKVDDGIVRIQYQTELLRPIVDVPVYREYDVPVPLPRPWYPPSPWYPRPRSPFYGTLQRQQGQGARRSLSSGRVGAASGSSSRVKMSAFKSSSSLPRMDSVNTSCNDVGITVSGGVSQQRFVAVQGFETTGQDEVLVLHLRGIVAGKIVTRPMTVKTRLTCASCGKASKEGEFCQRCGTALAV